MTDVFDPEKRSDVMSKIKGSGNKDTELALIKLFCANGIKGWRRNQRLPGKPDFVFRRERVAVFVDGCFWHCCPEHYTAPKNRAAFWAEKIAGNKVRDAEVNAMLAAKGWRVVRIWEHELSARRSPIVAARIGDVLEVN